jgi:hypothetical protein
MVICPERLKGAQIILISLWYGTRPIMICIHSDQKQARLQEDFPFLPKAYLRGSLNSFDGRYAPTYISLAEQEEQYEVGKHSKRPVKLPYKRRKIAFRPINNGKNKDLYDEEFEKECAWVVREVMDGDDECEGGIECGCCFASYRFVRVTALSVFVNLIYQAAKHGSVSRSTFVLPNLHEILCC